MQKLNIQQFKIGIQAIKMEREEFIILLLKGELAEEEIQKFHGR